MARNKYDIDEELEEKFDFKQLKRMLGYLAPFKLKICGTVLLMLYASGLMLLGPYFFQSPSIK